MGVWDEVHFNKNRRNLLSQVFINFRKQYSPVESKNNTYNFFSVITVIITIS